MNYRERINNYALKLDGSNDIYILNKIYSFILSFIARHPGIYQLNKNYFDKSIQKLSQEKIDKTVLRDLIYNKLYFLIYEDKYIIFQTFSLKDAVKAVITGLLNNKKFKLVRGLTKCSRLLNKEPEQIMQSFINSTSKHTV